MSLPLINLSLGRKQTFTGHDTGTDPCLLLWRSWLIREVDVEMWNVGGKVSTLKAVETEQKK